MHQLTVLGRTLTTWRIAKLITMPATRGRSPNTSTHCILVLESPKKTQHSQALDGTTLTQRRDTPRSAPIVQDGPLRPVGRQDPQSSGSMGSWCKTNGLCTPILCCSRRTPYGVWNTDCWGCVWGPLSHPAKQNKGACIKPETEKYFPTHSDMLHTVWWALYLGKDIFQARDPFLCGWVGWKDYGHEASFPDNYVWHATTTVLPTTTL